MDTKHKQASTKHKLFVGLDLGLVSTGLIILNNKGELYDSKRIVTYTTMTDYARVEHIFSSIGQTIQACLHRHGGEVDIEPYTDFSQVVANIERLAFNVEPKKSKRLDMICYMHHRVREHLEALGVEYHVISPATLKKFAVGIGRCKKQDVIDACKERWGFLTGCSDLADAYTMAKMAFEDQFGPEQKVLPLEKARKRKGTKKQG